MTRGIEITLVDPESAGPRVCHYDQLDEDVKDRFPALVPDGGVEAFVETEDPEAFEAYDVVKYTHYFRISPVEGGPASD